MISKTNQDPHVNLHVITGGPGVGKTALLQELHPSVFSSVAEDVRRTIQQRVASAAADYPGKIRSSMPI